MLKVTDKMPILTNQVHPLGLCNTSSDGKWKKYGWVGIVKLTVPDEDNPPCFTLFEKVSKKQ